MVRVPYVSREELDAEGQKIYDTIREDRGTEEVGLQFRALLNSPQSAGHLTSPRPGSVTDPSKRYARTKPPMV